MITGSASMLAEGIHSVADTSNQALLLLGRRQARRGPTAEHQFGFSRARYFWAFVVSVVLFTLGGVFAIVEGIDKLRSPHAVESIGWAVAILLVSIVLEGASLRTARQESQVHRLDRSWWRFVQEVKAPELPIVLLEDLGALVGLGIALVGVVLAHVFDEPRWDALGSLGIGVLLVVIAIVLAVRMRSLLIGEAASVADQGAIERAITESPGVVRLIHVRTQHLGPDHIVVAAKVEFTRTFSVSDVAETIDRIEVAIRAVVPEARTIYIEPDVYQPR